MLPKTAWNLKETPSLSLSHNWNHRYISPAEENLKVCDGTLQKRNWSRSCEMRQRERLLR